MELAYKVLESRSAEYWKRAKVLIIDEISMVSAELFDKLDYIARVVRGLNQPFGGIQLVVCGDFFQLPPVVKKEIQLPEKGEEQIQKKGKDSSNGEGGEDAPVFCFESKAWKEAIDLNFELTEVFRQKGDPTWMKMLKELRMGRCSAQTERRLLACQNNTFVSSSKRTGMQGLEALRQDGDEEDGIEPTRMYSTNRDVDDMNERMLNNLEGKGKKYKSQVIIFPFSLSFFSRLPLLCSISLLLFSSLFFF